MVRPIGRKLLKRTAGGRREDVPERVLDRLVPDLRPLVIDGGDGGGGRSGGTGHPGVTRGERSGRGRRRRRRSSVSVRLSPLLELSEEVREAVQVQHLLGKLRQTGQVGGVQPVALQEAHGHVRTLDGVGRFGRGRRRQRLLLLLLVGQGPGRLGLSVKVILRPYWPA